MFGFHWHFIAAQIAATYVAMTENFFLNNLVTWRDRSLRGMRLVSGLASFWLACSFGAWANVIFARALLPVRRPLVPGRHRRHHPQLRLELLHLQPLHLATPPTHPPSRPHRIRCLQHRHPQLMSSAKGAAQINNDPVSASR